LAARKKKKEKGNYLPYFRTRLHDLRTILRFLRTNLPYFSYFLLYVLQLRTRYKPKPPDNIFHPMETFIFLVFH